MVQQKTEAASTRTAPTIAQSWQEYARGVAGGLIFSLPLLFTMEMWQFGMVLHPARLLLYVLVTFVLLLGYNRYVGLHRETAALEVVIDSVEEMGIGLVIAALMMFLLGRITLGTPLREAVGILVIEAMTVAVGVSVGTAQLGAASSGAGNEEEAPVTLESQLAIAACGATLFAANVAPTEEIVQLGLEMSPLRLLGVTFLSLLLSAMILGFSDFRGAQRFAPSRGALSVFSGAVLSYAVALAVSAMILWFFGRFDGSSVSSATAQCVVLALPGALGASAGRLLLQTQ